MFRNLSKPQLTNIKQHNCIGIRAFDSPLYLYISSEKNRLYLFQGISSVPNVHLWSV